MILFTSSFVVSLAGGILSLVLGNLRQPLVVLVGSPAADASGANVVITS